jgi:hypothetical protein
MMFRAGIARFESGRKKLKSVRQRDRFFPFFDGVITIYSGWQLQPLHLLIWPMDFHLIDRRRVSQTKMKPLIIRRSKAATTDHVPALANAGGT